MAKVMITAVIPTARVAVGVDDHAGGLGVGARAEVDLGHDPAQEDGCGQPIAGPYLLAAGEHDAAEQEPVGHDEAGGEGAEAGLERPAAVVPAGVEAPVEDQLAADDEVGEVEGGAHSGDGGHPDEPSAQPRFADLVVLRRSCAGPRMVWSQLTLGRRPCTVLDRQPDLVLRLPVDAASPNQRGSSALVAAISVWRRRPSAGR
jgi:hypothetical protein